MKTLLVICARRGSQRLKLKHHSVISKFPLWRYAVHACAEVKNALSVVSSDDMRIKRELDKWRKMSGEYVPWITRPDMMATTTAPIHLTLQHAVETMRRACVEPDVVGFIPANVPTITPRLVRKCIKRMKDDPRLTGLITIREVRDKPEWMWGDNPWEPGLLPAFPALRNGVYREQDLPRRYVATGTVNLVRTKVLMDCTSHEAFQWLGPTIGGVLDNDAIEIHTKRDFEVAKAVMEAKYG